MRECFAAVLLVVCTLASASLFGQSNYGVITGMVSDAQHLPIAGAAIQLTATSTGAFRRMTAYLQGRFEAPALLRDDFEMNS